MKFLRITLVAALLAVFVIPAVETYAAVKATPTSSTVLVDGKSKTFDSYNINGFNYFKLRDIAYVMNGTAKQFGVDWDASQNAMTLNPGAAYKVTGGEMTSKGSATKSATLSQQKVFVTGLALASKTPMEAYNIDGYNYFKLRDIGIVLNIGIGWDDSKNTITIESTKGYVECQSFGRIDQSISDAAVAYYKGMFGGGDIACETHITLKTVEDGNKITVYVMSLYQEFNKTGDTVKAAGGANVPAAITFKKDSNGVCSLVEFWAPENGNKYNSSIQNKFPQDLWNKVDTQFYLNALTTENLAQAIALNNGALYYHPIGG